MAIERFEDIQGWQEARKLAVLIYRMTAGEQFARYFGLRDQIQRASVSIMVYIAEGFGRNSNRYFVRFLNIAKGSAYEVQSHLYVALDLEYITKDQFDVAYGQCQTAARLIGGFAKYLSEHAGPPKPETGNR